MERQRWTDEKIDSMMGRLLQAGVILASTLMIVGAITFLSRHGGEVPNYKTFRPSHSHGLLETGVLVMLATPVLRVAFAAFAFARERDWLYVAISSTVLALLAFGILFSR